MVEPARTHCQPSPVYGSPSQLAAGHSGGPRSHLCCAAPVPPPPPPPARAESGQWRPDNSWRFCWQPLPKFSSHLHKVSGASLSDALPGVHLCLPPALRCAGASPVYQWAGQSLFVGNRLSALMRSGRVKVGLTESCQVPPAAGRLLGHRSARICHRTHPTSTWRAVLLVLPAAAGGRGRGSDHRRSVELSRGPTSGVGQGRRGHTATACRFQDEGFSLGSLQPKCRMWRRHSIRCNPQPPLTDCPSGPLMQPGQPPTLGRGEVWRPPRPQPLDPFPAPGGQGG